MKEVYSIYEVLSIFTGQQIVRGVLRFGFALRRFRSIKGLISFKVMGGTFRVLDRQGDEIAKVIDGKLQPIKFIDDGVVIKEMPEGVLVRKGEEIGFKAVVGKISKNVVKLDDNLDLGKFVTKIGDYKVYEKGEVFYRTISKSNYNQLLKNKKLLGTGEATTSPNQIFSEGYEGILVQFKVNRGTIQRLEEIGVAAQNNKNVLLKHPNLKADVAPWNIKYARFKLEKGQVNIALGKGRALKIFNDNLVEFKFIKDLTK